MNRFIFLTVSSIIVVLLSISCTILIVRELGKYKVNKEEVAEVLNFQNRLLNTAEWIPFSSAGSDKIKQSEVLLSNADSAYQKGVFYGLGLLGGVVLYLSLNILLYVKSVFKYRAIGIAFIVSSLCFIVLGLQTPFLEIEALNTDLTFELDDIPLIGSLGSFDFEGDIYYLYQNKSVFEVIGLLFTGGNIVVGITLTLFSIVFPLFKLIASLLVLAYPGSKYSNSYVTVINLVGKWSMADVFVAAIFLAFFAFSNMNVGVNTNSNTLIGLYYFLCFVILSIGSGYFLKKATSHKASELESIL